MSTAWFKRNEAAGPQGAGASQAAPQPAGDPYAKTAPTPMSLPAAERTTLPPAAAFAPTLTMDQTVGHEPVAPPPLLAPVPDMAPVSAPAPAPSPAGPRLLGDVPEFNVEVVAAAKQDPEIEEAAIRFANGDVAGAEAVLLDLVGMGGSRRDDVDTWLTLFDLYRCASEPTKFDDAAFDFAAIFGRSAPQWALVTEVASSPAPMAAQPAAVSAGLFHWTCPSTMGTQSVAALKATLDRHAPPWRIDWRHVKAVEPAAVPGLIDVLSRWAETPARLKFHGAERLLEVLTGHSPTDDREADPQWWLARLALLRVMGEMDEFELVALNYCVTYEVSPPAWEEPRSSYSNATKEGQTLVPSELPAEEGPAPAPSFAGTEAPAAGPAVDNGIVKATFEGEYIGTADEALQPLNAQTTATAYEINCRKLLRVDFGAAGDLLNWCMEQQGKGRSVTLKQVNRLVAAFFGVIGITESARVMLRTD